VRKKRLRYIAITLVLLSLLLGCAGPATPGRELQPVVLLPQLNFELEDFVGEEVWSWGFYGDDGFTGDGIGFLVLNFHMLRIDEKLADHSFARLDGDLPPPEMNGAEILVYGKVKDFAQTYDAYTILPTPLITVESYHIVTPPEEVAGREPGLLPFFAAVNPLQATKVLAQAAAGTKAQACDRALIISGGVDDNNNHARYRENIKAKYKRLKELGFSDDQIDVLYNDGKDIAGITKDDGKSVVDGKCTKQKIKDALDKYKREMPGSCTLTIFVTDHGTGYNEGQGWDGARPALSGVDASGDTKRYSEQLFKIDLKKKVYRQNIWTNPANGDRWRVKKDEETNRLELYKSEGGYWRLKGEDGNGDGRISEAEAGQDINGDGDKSDDNIPGLREADLGPTQHRQNEWDTDTDGKPDVRARWDGSKYVVERLKPDGTWHKMGEDKNGDHVIDSDDGGLDWNLDGDTDYYDLAGFHEGINLWGDGKDSVLWDDEFADMLRPLHEKGIHILVEMAQCFGGGFIANLKDIVEKIVSFSSEDTKHTNRAREVADPANPGKKKTTYYAADQEAFMKNLAGIDVNSWDTAFDKAKEVDTQKWKDEGSVPEDENIHSKWEKPLIEGGTYWEIDGVYSLFLVIPKELEGKVHDIEMFFGLQKPRWAEGEVLKLPAGFTKQKIAGGIRIESANAFPTSTPLEFKFKGAKGAQSMRVHVTDKDHKNLGYMEPAKGVPPPPKPVYTRSPKMQDNAEDLGWYEGTKDGIEGTTEEMPRSEYIDFVKLRLIALIASADPSVTDGMKDAAEELLDFLEGAGEDDQQWAADIFLDNYYMAAEAALPPVSSVLSAAFAASAKSVSDQSGCTSTLSISYDARDLTGGGFLVTSVVLKVNGVVWHDSGTISIEHYQNSVDRQVGCGETFNIEVTATNERGQTVISTGPITTPVP